MPKSKDSGRILNAFEVEQAVLRTRCWFEYAPVAQNTPDSPSCEAFARMREVMDAASDPEWILYFWEAVEPRQGRLWATRNNFAC